MTTTDADIGWCDSDGCPSVMCGGPHRYVLTSLGLESVPQGGQPIGQVDPTWTPGRWAGQILGVDPDGWLEVHVLERPDGTIHRYAVPVPALPLRPQPGAAPTERPHRHLFGVHRHPEFACHPNPGRWHAHLWWKHTHQVPEG